MRRIRVQLMCGLLAATLAAPLAAKPFAALRPLGSEPIAVQRPTLVFGGELPTGVERESLRILVDQDDVTEFARWTGDRLRVTVPLPLAVGEHTATVAAGGLSESAQPIATLEFSVASPASARRSTTKYSDSMQLELDDEDSVSLGLQPHFDGRIEGARGSLAYDVTLSHELRFEGEDDDFEEPDASIEWVRPGLEARLGTIADPHGFSESEFLGVTAYRQGLDAQFGGRSPVSLFSNLADSLPTVTGERSFDQRIGGATWRLPTRGERLSIRLMGLSVEDRKAGDSVLSRPETADLFGALLSYRWSENWETTVEFASSDREVDELGRRTAHRDDALRLALAGAFGKHRLQARFARVGGRFGNPADPRLTGDREEADLSLSRRSTRWNYKLHWRSASDGLEGSVRSSDESRYGGSFGLRLVGIDTRLEWSRQTLDSTSASSEQTRSRLTLGRNWKRLRFELQGGRTENERQGYGFSDSQQDWLKASWRWSGEKGWSIRGGLSGTERTDLSRIRETRELFLEPSWRSTSGRLRTALYLALGMDEVPGITDRTRRTARGTLDWQLGPGETWTLGVELSMDETENTLSGTEITDDRGLLRITYSPQTVWGTL